MLAEHILNKKKITCSIQTTNLNSVKLSVTDCGKCMLTFMKKKIC